MLEQVKTLLQPLADQNGWGLEPLGRVGFKLMAEHYDIEIRAEGGQVTVSILLDIDAGLLFAIDPNLDQVMLAVAQKYGHHWAYFNQSWRAEIEVEEISQSSLKEAVNILCDAADWLIELHCELKGLATKAIARRLLRTV